MSKAAAARPPNPSTKVGRHSCLWEGECGSTPCERLRSEGNAMMSADGGAEVRSRMTALLRSNRGSARADRGLSSTPDSEFPAARSGSCTSGGEPKDFRPSSLGSGSTSRRLFARADFECFLCLWSFPCAAATLSSRSSVAAKADFQPALLDLAQPPVGESPVPPRTLPGLAAACPAPPARRQAG